jgi:hypothetical protein
MRSKLAMLHDTSVPELDFYSERLAPIWGAGAGTLSHPGQLSPCRRDCAARAHSGLPAVPALPA